MKKVLILIHNMKIGGAQKSLLSFLECLSASSMKEKYEIHLMIPHIVGPLLPKVPEMVKMIPAPLEYKWLSSPFSFDFLLHHFSLRGLIAELVWIVRKGLKLYPSQWNNSQLMWHCWKNLIHQHPTYYDTVVSYIDGSTNYFAIEKVSAGKKVLWIHNEHQKHGYSSEFDLPYYAKADAVVTISEKCRQSFLQDFPEYAEKTHVLENISSYSNVLSKSLEGFCREFSDPSCLKLLSVGRLHHLKGYDLAICAARILKEKHIRFKWIVVGEGSEREKLQKMIDEYDLNDCFQLVGMRENPYVYMQGCDILVQSSRTEGKSIVLDEAKMLCKPIVVTNYVTVKDSIEHGESGWIVDMTPNALADGIIKLSQDQALHEKIVKYLHLQPKGNEDQLNRYIEIML